MNEQAPAPQPEPGLSRHDRILIRISIMQTVLAALGIFTGAVALYAALSQADSTRKQQQAMVWPELMISPSFVGGDDEARFGLVAWNSGIGPARMRAFRVTVDGEAHRNWRGALTALLGAPPGDLSVDLIGARTIPPDTALTFVMVEGGGRPAAMRSAIYEQRRMTVEACYCSVFDDCWLTSLVGPEGLSREKVRACPDYGDEQFSE